MNARFWAKVKKTDSCWLWTAAKRAGYGTFKLSNPRRDVFAHRISWQLHNGVIPPGMWILHHCDVRACVRPDHLFLGTNSDNQLDSVRKGRHYLKKTRGEKRHFSKLLPYQVLKIRASAQQGIVQRRLAERFGVAPSTICKIVKRYKWNHLP